MPTSRTTLRQRLGEAIEDHQALTAGGGSTTTIVDTSLKDLSGGDDDFCAGWYILVTSGDAGGDVRRITSYADSTQTITVNSAFSGGGVADGDTYELHVINPADKHNALNRALEELFPFVYLPVRDTSVVLDNVLSNAGFDMFSGGAFTGWSAVGGPTITQDTSRVFHGAGAAKLVAGGSAGQLTQTPVINVREVTGRPVRFWCWAYATVAGKARIRLDWDGSSFANSSYHSGVGQWELLKVEATIPGTATQVKAIVEAAAGATAYFDAARLWTGPLQKYALPSSIQRLHGVRMQHLEERESDDATYLPLGGYDCLAPVSGRRLLLEGTGLLTRPATDNDTTEISGVQVDLVVARALHWLLRAIASSPRLAASEVERHKQTAAEWLMESKRLIATPGVRMPPLPVSDGRGVWHIEEDASGKYLVLDVPRA
ncbi:MAG: hypothetical protein FJ317_03890 [SAR202 cluster bacterium]|nr:hypothetical protein [SAR202 cluster bacterium]